MITSIIITNDAARRLCAGEPWFSERDVVGRVPRIAGVARLLDKRRRFLAQALFSPGSRTCMRVISREDRMVDREFWRERMKRAYARRAKLIEVTDAVRVVHAEADGIPSVVIDKFADVWALQITSAAAEAMKGDFISIIAEEFAPRAIVEKNGASVRKADGLPTEDRVALGDAAPVVVREGDERFEVDVLAGQKTGAYLDYRAFRLAARELARGRCLDAFCYQGWFSCQIAAHADAVVGVDSSAKAVESAARNSSLNNHMNASFVRSDVIDYLKGCGEKFDFLHLDPPSYAKGHGDLAAAKVGYRKLLAAALPLVRKNGVIMVSSCSHAISERILENELSGAIISCGMTADVVYRGIQDSDHPLLRGHPESLYLKAIAARLT